MNFKMFFFLLHIFKKHCGLLKPRGFVTFIITSHYLHYVLYGNAHCGLGFLCDRYSRNAWLFLPWKADDFDFSEYHLGSQVLCFICYRCKVACFHPWQGKINQHSQSTYAFFLHSQTIIYFHICTCSSINSTLWHFIFISLFLKKKIILKSLLRLPMVTESSCSGHSSTGSRALQQCHKTLSVLCHLTSGNGDLPVRAAWPL